MFQKTSDRLIYITDPEGRQKQMLMERKHSDAQAAWRNFADHLGQDDIKKFLGVSSDKIFTLYEELQASDTPQHLVSQFEDVISALMADVKNMETETKKMEEKMSRSVLKSFVIFEKNVLIVYYQFFRERESHTAHLKTIEAELDAQVARVESAAREKARRDHENEKREIQEKMEVEMAQLQSQLKIFQKVKITFPRNERYSQVHLKCVASLSDRFLPNHREQRSEYQGSSTKAESSYFGESRIEK